LSILVVGSVALDDVQTVEAARTKVLGGACTYFATAASLYDRVNVVAVVGTDFPQEHIDFLRSRNIDLRGLQVVDGKTFSWSGRYGKDFNVAETLDTQLNVFAHFAPILPEDYRQSECVFLANIDPDLQLAVLEQVRGPRLIALDSMNDWIDSKRDSLTQVMSKADLVLFNENEARLFAQESNLLSAAHLILGLGPSVVVIKRGEHGAMIVTRGESLEESLFLIPAYPLEHVVDPTGAGDTFAAGLVGYLARCECLSLGSLRKAAVHGTMVASFTVEDFGVDRLRSLTLEDIQERYNRFRYLTHFEALSPSERTGLQRALR